MKLVATELLSLLLLSLLLSKVSLPVWAQASPEQSPSVTGTPPKEQPTPASTPTAEKRSPVIDGNIVPTLPDPENVVTPELPPDLTVPEDALPSPLPTIPDAASADDLVVPQDPLQLRIEQTEGLSLEEALAIAIERNPQVEQARLSVDRASTTVEQARAAYKPIASSAATYSYNQSPQLGSPVRIKDTSRILSQLVRLDYTFLDSGRREIATKTAQETLKISELQLEQAIQTVKLAVANAYFLLQEADATLAVTRGAVENSQASLKDAQAQERAGLGTRFDVLRAETELANNQQTLIAAQNTRQSRQRLLAELLNLENPTDISATDPIQPQGNWELSLEETIVKALQSREELEVQRLTFELAQDQAKQAETTLKPRVDLFATVDGGADIQRRDSITAGYSAGAKFLWTWYDGGTIAAQVRSATIDAQIAARRFEQVRNEIRRSVEDAFYSLNSARQQIDNAKTAIASAREGRRLAQLRFQAGVGTQTEVISAETALTTAEGNLARSVTQYNLALIQLQRSVSGL
jgi:OMF family outer membrane factor